MTTKLSFHNTNLEIINLNNSIWLKASDLSKALEYKSTKSITNLFNENSDEFTPAMSLVIDSVTNGINGSKRNVKVRIFSLRGAHLIAMFARTQTAKEFRRWVLDVLDRETNEKQQKIEFTGRIVVHFENGVVTNQMLLRDDEHIASMQTLLEMAERAGYLVIDAIKLSDMIKKCSFDKFSIAKK